MKCEPITIAGGVGFMCSRGARRKTCSVCKVRKATKLCDFPLTGPKAGKTCDRDLCGTCAVNMGEVIRLSADPRWQSHKLRVVHGEDTVDFCPAHSREVTDGGKGVSMSGTGQPAKPPRAPSTQTSLDFIPPTRRDTTK
jgi:hypothetical protein